MDYEIRISDLNGMAAKSFLADCGAFHLFAGGVEVGGACRNASKVPARSVGMGSDYRSSFDAALTQFSTNGSIEQRNTCLNCVIGDGMSLSECAFVIASTVPIAPANPDHAE